MQPSPRPSAHFPHSLIQDPSASTLGGFPTRVVVAPVRSVPPRPASENLHPRRHCPPFQMLHCAFTEADIDRLRSFFVRAMIESRDKAADGLCPSYCKAYDAHQLGSTPINSCLSV